jgi:hypothetical protein
MPSPWEPGFLTFYQAEASSLSWAVIYEQTPFQREFAMCFITSSLFKLILLLQDDCLLPSTIFLKLLD